MAPVNKLGTKLDQLHRANEPEKKMEKNWMASIFLPGLVQSDGTELIQQDILGLAVAISIRMQQNKI